MMNQEERQDMTGEASLEVVTIPDAGGEKAGETPAETPAQRKSRYRALVEGEFKDLFTADTQRIIDRRFKETRILQETLEAQRPLMERLAGRYGGSDPATLLAAMEAEDQAREAERGRLDELLTRAAQNAAMERERAVLETIRARGGRPVENGGGAQNAVTSRIDPEKMTPAQREDIARRVMRGEIITFQ